MRGKNVIVMIVGLLLSTAMVAQKRNITEKDIFAFTWIGDTQLSPDGSRAIYVQTRLMRSGTAMIRRFTFWIRPSR